MQTKIYHILNGDALSQRFPPNIKGEKIIMRACLVDGPVKGNTKEELYHTRSQFIANHYTGFKEQDYHTKSVVEFEKIENIPTKSEVHLWFEQDLFCQVNMWYVFHLLQGQIMSCNIKLVIPYGNAKFSFAHLSNNALIKLYQSSTIIVNEDIEIFIRLWKLYQNNELKSLLKIANSMRPNFAFLLAAVQAHIDRLPNKKFPIGFPKQLILDIQKEEKTKDFSVIFPIFYQRASIYGFGDIQIERLWYEVNQNHNS